MWNISEYCAVLCLVAQSCLILCVHEDSPGKNTGVGYHALLQGIFLTQGSNPHLLYSWWAKVKRVPTLPNGASRQGRERAIVTLIAVFVKCLCTSGTSCSVQFISVAQSCPTLCDPKNRSTPGFPVHHQLPEFTQTHVHQFGDAIQPSHPLSSPSPPAPNPSQHQSLFQWVKSSYQVAKVLEFQL